MEIFIFILIYVGLLYVIYKFAESKNRESMGYTFAGLIVSPIIILIILAFLKKLPGPKKRKIKRKALRKVKHTSGSKKLKVEYTD